MRKAFHSLWAEPRAPQPPTRVWRDWVLVAVLAPAAILEVTLRQDLVWRPFVLVLFAALVSTLLWRRTQPLVVVAIGFGTLTAIHLAMLFGAESVELYAMAYMILLPYSLFRWGSGREAVTGLVIILSAVAISGFIDESIVAAIVGSAILLFFPAAVGVSVRYKAKLWLSEIDRVKLREREQLARELHDTVAHHVSAIAIHAQAGRTLAASQPGAPLDALEIIEEAASRTLAEMRSMVGVLRVGEETDLVPQRGVADIERLAHGAGNWPVVDVELSGDLDDLRPSVEAAIYRIAQESITNALRHARHATRIDVSVAGDGEWVEVTVRDDGHAGSAGRSSPGYGLVGMTERAKLLGGTLEAGPGADQGWTVSAVLPRAGSVT